jgi:antitoxin component of RelBE/YafQ-DinJ toxin-antitoxin module
VLDTDYVHTYYVNMNVTLSVDDEIIARARQRAEALGTSVNQLMREYLEQLAGKSDPNEDAAEFERLSKLSNGDSRGWKFNRDEIHERR